MEKETTPKPATAASPLDIAETLRFVKRSLHGMMNGVAAASLREKGLRYKVIFGVELPRLQAFASELPSSHALAQALWKEDIRECRLLAGMVQPADSFLPEIADIWVESMHFPEEAECTTCHLFARLPYASQKAFEWIAREEAMFQLCGFLLLGRLFTQGARPAERDAQEFLDQAEAAMKGGAPAVRNAAGKTLLKYMDFGEAEASQGDKLLASLQA